jgi:hypothetical protein
MLTPLKPRIPLLTVLLTGLLGMVTSPAIVTAQFSADARWAPAQTNVLTMINSERIFKSKLALKERAAEASKAAFDSGVSIVTPDADRILIATQLDLEVMHTISTAAVYSRARSKFDLNAMANKIGSSVDSIAGRGTVLLPNDAMVVELGPDTVGVMKPGNRQAVSNWLRAATGSGSNQLTRYLVEAVSFADRNADIIIAMDLQDAVSPTVIKDRLGDMNSVEKNQVDAIAEILSGIKGITLGVTVRDSITGSIKVDFPSSAKGLDKVGKPLLLEILGNRGLMIDDLSTWSVKSTDQQLLFSGPLSIAGLRAITSLVSQPLLPEFIAEESGVEDAAYARSKTYCKSLETYVTELTTKKPNSRGLKAYATWFETYAAKINGFSILNVDPELVAVGNSVADSLREMAKLARQANVQIKQGKAEIRTEGNGYNGYNGYGNNNGYGRYGYSQPSRSSRLKQAETASRGNAEDVGREILESIQKDVTGIRQKMSTKYGVNF